MANYVLDFSGAQVNSKLSAEYALKNSPELTGTPTAPTAANGTNTTQIATTQFVNSAIATNKVEVVRLI